MKKIILLFFYFIISVNIQHVHADSVQFERVIVTFNHTIDENVIENQDGYIEEYLQFIEGVIAIVPNNKIEAIQNNPSVKQVESDSKIFIANQSVDWGVEKIKAPINWREGYTGNGVKVAVLDTGVSPHPDLQIAGGKSFVNYTTDYSDDNGHGTHIAGTIAARNNDIGYIGISPKTEIYALKVMDPQGEGNTIDLAFALEWAIKNKMDIINLSFQFDEPIEYIESLVNKAYENEILVVSAAGNCGEQNCEMGYPAIYPSVIAVGAVDSNLNRATFSTADSELEVVAPGVTINSTYLGNGYRSISGTSMATAYVSGYLALLKEAYPNASSDDIRRIMNEHVMDLGIPGRDPLYGYGLIQGFESKKRAFNTSDKFFRVISPNTSVYDNSTGKLIKIGSLESGQVFSRTKDYGNWHQINFGNRLAYVHKDATYPILENELEFIIPSYKDANLFFTTLNKVTVYDNSSGRLIPFATILKDERHSIVSDYGNWWKVEVAGRIGYVNKAHVRQEFEKSTPYFRVNIDKLPVYDNRSGKLIIVGSLEKGQIYPRVSDYGNWHRIEFGGHFGYVYKDSTSPINQTTIKNLNKTYQTSNQSFTTLEETIVYDNSTVSLIPFATIKKGKTYPIISDYGNWWRVDVSGRIGFVNKANVRLDFSKNTPFFRVNVENLPVYDNRSGKLIQMGTLTEGQVYPRVSDYGDWHQIQFGEHYGYVYKDSTTAVAQSSLGNLNKTYQQSKKSFITLKNVIVYDNTSGFLVPFGTIEKGTNYPIISDYGNWWRVLVSGRIGYVNKAGVRE